MIFVHKNFVKICICTKKKMLWIRNFILLSKIREIDELISRKISQCGKVVKTHDHWFYDGKIILTIFTNSKQGSNFWYLPGWSTTRANIRNYLPGWLITRAIIEIICPGGQFLREIRCKKGRWLHEVVRILLLTNHLGKNEIIAPQELKIIARVASPLGQ